MAGASWTTTLVGTKYLGASTGVAPSYASNPGAAPSAAATFYITPGSKIPASGSSTEAGANAIVPFAMTASLLTARLSANGASDNATLTSRKNSGAGNQTVTITGSASGTFQDTTHSDTYAAGDTMCAKLVEGVFGAGTYGSIGWKISATQAAGDNLLGQVWL